MPEYADLKSQCEDHGWTCLVYPVEVMCLGFIGRSVIRFLGDIGVASREGGSLQLGGYNRLLNLRPLLIWRRLDSFTRCFANQFC